MRRSGQPTTATGATGATGARQSGRSQGGGPSVVGQSRAAAAGAVVALGGNSLVGRGNSSARSSSSSVPQTQVARPGSSARASVGSVVSRADSSLVAPALSEQEPSERRPSRNSDRPARASRRSSRSLVVISGAAATGANVDERRGSHGDSHLDTSDSRSATDTVEQGVLTGMADDLWFDAPSVESSASATRETDPFGLDGGLFEYVTHKKGHGEVFVGYRVRGNPMVLHSLVDGSPLVSLHFRVAKRGAHALIARRPDREGLFQGVISADNQAFELVMTNLTTEDVIMCDVGGEPRSRVDEFWGRDDKSFWSGKHRNDQRLNGSNILWPMQPNVCVENNLHFQQTGERRQLVLRRHDTAPVAPATDASAGTDNNGDRSTYELFVYPKHGSRTCTKFERTAWSCPASIVVIGNPALVGDSRQSCRVQLESPRADQNERGIEGVARTFGMSLERLFDVLGVDMDFFMELPEDLQQDILVQRLSNVDPTLLRPDSPEEQDTAVAAAVSQAPLPRCSQRSESNSQEEATLDAVALGAAPAQVSAGRRLRYTGARSVLIERFDFDRRSASARLALGVDERVQLLAAANGSRSVDVGGADLRAELTKRISELADGRTDSLREEIASVFQTKECVICLSSDPLPDVILYQCGHRCAHLECLEDANLRRCPLCRAPIVALLPCK